MIYTWSKFNFGHDVTVDNKYIPFAEGAGELLAEVAIGNYTLAEFAQAVEDALNTAGALTYVVTLSRTGNILTVAASGTFQLLAFTGSTTSTAYSLMGFETTSDRTGAATYAGPLPSGTEYFPQFQLQSYVPPENYIESVDPTINTTGDGRVEVVNFGRKRMIEMDIKFITDLPMDGQTFGNNPTGLQDARDFLDYISQKKVFEFVPDELTPGTFHKVILEKSQNYGNGTGFKLKELFTQGLNDIYETGVFTLRVIA